MLEDETVTELLLLDTMLELLGVTSLLELLPSTEELELIIFVSPVFPPSSPPEQENVNAKANAMPADSIMGRLTMCLL
jgi:hypothetical protein